MTQDDKLTEFKVSTRTTILVYPIATVSIIAILLSLLNIGFATAFKGVISIPIAGLFASYLPVSILLL